MKKTTPTIDFSAVLRDLDGAEISDGGKPLTLARVASAALLQAYIDESTLAGEIKVRRFVLAMKVAEAGELELTAEETAMLKERVAKGYGPLVVGRAWELLDPAALKG